jgi:hypothetical protein
MKQYLSILVLLCIVGICPAAHFEHYESRLWSQVGGWAEDADESDPVDDPGTFWREQNVMSRFDTTSVHSFASSSVTSGNCSQDGTFSALIAGSTLTLSGTVVADANTFDTDGIVNSYAGFSLVDPGMTSGFFYKVMPDAGENEGDMATVTVTLTGTGSAPAPGRTSFGGGMGSQAVLVAVNLPIPSPEPVGDEYIAYSYPLIENVNSYSVNDTATFKVKVGHTIAIFLGADVSVTLGPDSTESIAMSANAQMSLDITDVNPYISVCDECDLDKSGTVDMGDFALLAAAWLADAYPFPPPPPPAPAPGTVCSLPFWLSLDYPESGQLASGESAWYEFSPDEDSCCTISLCNSDFDTAVEIYDECGGYLIGFDDDGCGPQSRLEISLQQWHSYYIRIRGKTIYDSGYYEVQATQGCSGSGSFVGSDSCENAPTIELYQQIDDDTTGATGNDETMECGYDSDDRDLWYKFVAPHEGPFNIELYCDYYSSFDGTLSTWDGCEGYDLSCTEVYEGYGYASEYLYEGQEILIRIGSYTGGEGAFSLTVYEIPI